jgi:hypothetical protein
MMIPRSLAPKAPIRLAATDPRKWRRLDWNDVKKLLSLKPQAGACLAGKNRLPIGSHTAITQLFVTKT